MLITPLDTCGQVWLTGDRFAKLKECSDPLTGVLLENYRIWWGEDSISKLSASTCLYDNVAVYLAQRGPKDLLQFETLNIELADDGWTTVGPAGKEMTMATEWENQEGFYDLLLSIYQQPTVQRQGG
jgi:inosine-uridine nucleoside N-ribohydrolase